MKYNFDEIIDRRKTYSTKWGSPNFLKAMGLCDRFDDNTISAFTADMDFPCPRPVVDAMHRVADHQMYGYSAHIDVPEYYDAIIRWMRDKHGWEVKKEEIIYSPGTKHALYKAVEAFTEVGDGILLTRPIYSPIASAVESNNRVLVNSQLINTEGYYTIDFEDFAAKASDENVKMFILCSPHNPSGRLWNKEELVQMADICQRHNVLIVSDEIHGDLLRKGQRFIPIASVADSSNIITLTATNKTFNTAGLHCSNVIVSDPEMRAKLSKAIGSHLPTPFAIAAVIAAYTEGDEWLEQVNEYIEGNLNFVADFLAQRMPKVKVRVPEATYILWMDFSEYNLTEKQRRELIYNQANVLLEPGSMFDPGNEDFERICVPLPRPLLKEAMERIAKTFEESGL